MAAESCDPERIASQTSVPERWNACWQHLASDPCGKVKTDSLTISDLACGVCGYFACASHPCGKVKA